LGGHYIITEGKNKRLEGKLLGGAGDLISPAHFIFSNRMAAMLAT
jgi:hypothetical protein